ncbi:MAG: Gldg family protein [Planctomycetes bacterium]|nr:Gldg family protein [Planctomycetota bacterium]MCB9889272.1 Gldg family protein [Planctomycetota bacterium]
MSAKLRSLLGAALIIVCTLCAAFVLGDVTESWGWLDTTSNSRYTLTEGTMKVLEKVNRPLKARLYFSNTAVQKVGTDQLKRYVRAYYHARDLLRAYQRKSGGKVQFLEFDPKPFTDTAEEAIELGVRQFELPGDQLFFFGLVVSSDLGPKEVIPLINYNEENLFEYKVSKMIERVAHPTKKKVGVVSSLDVVGQDLSPEMKRLRRFQQQSGGEPWHIVEWLKRDYEVVKVDATAKEIPADLDSLIVVHPKNFGEGILYAIDQYVMRGGKLLVFVDPFCEVDTPPNTPGNPYARFSHPHGSDLNRLLSAWGVKMTPGKIVGDRAIAGMRGNTKLMPYNIFTQTEDCFNKNEVVSEPLSAEKESKVLTGYVGQLEKVDGTKVDVQPLIQTSSTGGTRKFGNMDMMSLQAQPEKLWLPPGEGNPDGFELAGKPVVVAMRMRGKMPSAFADGKPKSLADTNGSDPKKDDKADKKDKKSEHRKESSDAAAVVVIADVDMISNNMVVQPQSFFGSPYANTAVVLNALDFLNGSGDLMSIRSRSAGRREFDRIKEIERRAADRTSDKVSQINREIETLQKKMRELQDKATEKNVGQLRGEALQQERETQRVIAKKKKELRDVQAKARDEVESVKRAAEVANVMGMPLLVFLIGLVLWLGSLFKRSNKMREDMA